MTFLRPFFLHPVSLPHLPSASVPPPHPLPAPTFQFVTFCCARGEGPPGDTDMAASRPTAAASIECGFDGADLLCLPMHHDYSWI